MHTLRDRSSGLGAGPGGNAPIEDGSPKGGVFAVARPKVDSTAIIDAHPGHLFEAPFNGVFGRVR